MYIQVQNISYNIKYTHTVSYTYAVEYNQIY